VKRYAKYINVLFLVLIGILASNCSTNPEKRIIGTWETETLLTDGYGSRYVMIVTMDFKRDQCMQDLYFQVSEKIYNSVACTYVIEGDTYQIELDNGIEILGIIEGNDLILTYSSQITNAAEEKMVFVKSK